MSPHQIEQHLLSATKLKGFVTPVYDGYSLASIAPTILKGVGSRTQGIPEEAFDYSVFKGVKNIVLVGIDALGYSFLSRGMKKLAHIPLTSVAPSTTTCAWPSVFTGLTPQEHGITGFWIYLRELDAVTSMIRFGPSTGMGSFTDAGIDPTLFFPFETIHTKMKKKGFAPTVVNRHDYIESGLSHMIYQGAKQVSYRSMPELFAKGSKQLEKGKNFLTLYVDTIDITGHLSGVGSRELKKDLSSLTKQLERFIEKAPKDTLVLVTADHGQINCPQKKQLSFSDHPELLSRLAVPPNGEGRVVYLNCKPGRKDKVHDYVQQHFNKQVVVFDSKEVLKMGLLGQGKEHKETSRRIGDLVLIVKDRYVLTYPYLEGRGIIGFHGGLSREEMLVPLLWRRT